MLEELKEQVLLANVDLVRSGLVVLTWGNVSGVDRYGGHVVIKPSGVDYESMRPEDMVVVSLDDGQVVEGDLRPSSDTPTHLELYRAWKDTGGIVHTHSRWATAWAQGRREIPPLGTTHADFAPGYIPCTRPLNPDEIRDDYEANTGRVIVERFAKIKPQEYPAVLVAEHGPFAWGASPAEAVKNAIILEEVARIAAATVAIAPHAGEIQKELLDKHFMRKHGPDAYYGQS